MDFTVVDDIKEKAAQVSDLIDQAKSFADAGLDAAKNFVCVQILTIYQMVYLTAGQVIAIPYMAIKMAKQAIKKLDKAVISGAKDTFGSAVSTLMTTYTPEVVKYDPDTGLCTSEKKPSKIEEDPSYVQQALHALKAAKNCPLLDSFTSTAGFESAFSAVKLLAALEGTSPESAAAALANAMTDLATGMVDNLAKALEDTAFGALKDAKKMYKSALKQSGIEDIFKLLGQGQSCLMDLCDDEAVLLKLEDLPLTPYLAKAGGFVAEQMEKIDSSYFTFTFDIEKSTGADQLEEEQQIDTTLYEPLPIINGMQYTNMGAEALSYLNTTGAWLPEPYYSYYTQYATYKKGITDKYDGHARERRYEYCKLLHVIDNEDCRNFFIQPGAMAQFERYRQGFDEIDDETGKVIHRSLENGDYDITDDVGVALSKKGFLIPAGYDYAFDVLATDATKESIVSAIESSAILLCNTEAGILSDVAASSSYRAVVLAAKTDYKDSKGIQHKVYYFKTSSYRKNNFPDYFKTYTNGAQLRAYFSPISSQNSTASSDYFEPQTTVGTYALLPFKQK